MAKISAKPKKTPEQEAQELQALLEGADVSNGAGIPSQQSKPTAPASAPASSIEVEQKGEKAPATPPVATSDAPVEETAPALMSAVAATESTEEASLSASAPAPVVPEPAAPVSTAAPTLAEAVVSSTVAKQPITPEQAPSAALAPSLEDEPTDELTDSEPTDSEPALADNAPLDLATLFAPNPRGRKDITSRLTATHHQYLLTLGTVLGNGMSPPEIIYNLVEQFITKHDKEIQRAIMKKMRAARTPAKKS